MVQKLKLLPDLVITQTMSTLTVILKLPYLKEKDHLKSIFIMKITVFLQIISAETIHF